MVFGVLWDAGIAKWLKVPYISNTNKADAFFFVFSAFPAIQFHCVLNDYYDKMRVNHSAKIIPPLKGQNLLL